MLDYKNDKTEPAHKWFSLELDNRRENYGFTDSNESIPNSIELDFPMLFFGIPDAVNKIIHGIDILESVSQLASYLSKTTDFIKLEDLYSIEFISSLNDLINSVDILAPDLIFIITKLWRYTPESQESIFNNELISSFCRYFQFPNNIKKGAFEAIDFLLRKFPAKICLVSEFDLSQALDNYFLSRNGNTYNGDNSNENADTYIFQDDYYEKPFYFLLTMTINPFLEKVYYRTLMNISLQFITDQYHIPRICSSIILYELIVENNCLDLFLSFKGSIFSLIQAHLLNIPKMFPYLYKIGNILWNNGLENEFLSESCFMNNIAMLLINENFCDDLIPIFRFILNSMSKLWNELYLNSISFGEDSQPIISLILNFSNHSSLNNRVYATTCIASFILAAVIDSKLEVIMNEGFSSIINIIPCLNIEDSEHQIFLKTMLEALLQLISFNHDFIHILNDSDVPEFLHNNFLCINNDKLSQIIDLLLRNLQEYNQAIEQSES
ncbi:hypothetical protein TRFO_20777 [Tritrichomonas foetus]|uniref:Uncharacterized protein n=1 Tax=Tritrichomonas foetus TaxID=1144522 RepID=A0A1J4KGF1_9EUKA|nr:hypothetical protein TRFO_20777 [Tritrichomonas foetus]|eukprot:OHT10122.1 hypothetical protein TRFO_20777 [Tritrichomonas foetus]